MPAEGAVEVGRGAVMVHWSLAKRHDFLVLGISHTSVCGDPRKESMCQGGGGVFLVVDRVEGVRILITS